MRRDPPAYDHRLICVGDETDAGTRPGAARELRSVTLVWARWGEVSPPSGRDTARREAGLVVRTCFPWRAPVIPANSHVAGLIASDVLA